MTATTWMLLCTREPLRYGSFESFASGGGTLLRQAPHNVIIVDTVIHDIQHMHKLPQLVLAAAPCLVPVVALHSVYGFASSRTFLSLFLPSLTIPPPGDCSRGAVTPSTRTALGIQTMYCGPRARTSLAGGATHALRRHRTHPQEAPPPQPVSRAPATQRAIVPTVLRLQFALRWRGTCGAMCPGWRVHPPVSSSLWTGLPRGQTLALLARAVPPARIC